MSKCEVEALERALEEVKRERDELRAERQATPEQKEALDALDQVIGNIGAGANPSLLNKVEIERRNRLLLARRYILKGEHQ